MVSAFLEGLLLRVPRKGLFGPLEAELLDLDLETIFQVVPTSMQSKSLHVL